MNYTLTNSEVSSSFENTASEFIVIDCGDVLQGIFQPVKRIDGVFFADGKEGVNQCSSLCSVMDPANSQAVILSFYCLGANSVSTWLLSISKILSYRYALNASQRA
jgi:hypothetical protein